MSRTGPWFALSTARDLYAKLQRDYAAFEADPLSVDLAYNYFVTAWSLLDWKYPGAAHASTRRNLRDTEPILQVLDHVANGLKHFALDAKKHVSVKGTDRAGGYMGNWFGNYMGDWFGRRGLFVELDGPARSALGNRVEAIALAKAAMSFWDQEIDK
jgi:hypothetical protein